MKFFTCSLITLFILQIILFSNQINSNLLGGTSILPAGSILPKYENDPLVQKMIETNKTQYQYYTNEEKEKRYANVDCSVVAEVGDMVFVHYYGFVLSSTNIFDSSYNTPPLKIILGEGHMVYGFDYGVRGMCINETRVIYIPPNEAYGDKGFTHEGRTIIRPNDYIRFQIELVDVIKGPTFFDKAYKFVTTYYLYFLSIPVVLYLVYMIFFKNNNKNSQLQKQKKLSKKLKKRKSKKN
eukprot:TRINITY_DN263_c1_g1_i1.p1 TRINITY_DN263_c1_g1~~TRINITY_DN263_c1_g1_i1.p1  ORF type:complete len:239 (+),score=48.64 TRINITY_DN263_c1_g1_i1:947-1663(+)